MEDVLLFISLIFVILLLIGIISPKHGLFWVKGNRTRIKALLFYGVGLIVSIFALGMFLPNADKKDSKLTKEVKEYSPKNKNVKEWLSKSDEKKSKFIRKSIVGDWMQIYIVAFYSDDKSSNKFTINRNFKQDYTSKGDFVNYEKYINEKGFFDFPHYITKGQDDKGSKNNETSWQVVKKDLVLALGTKNQTNEEILYISDNLMVRKLIEPITGWEMYSYFARFENNSLLDFKDELNELIKLNIKEGYKLIQDGIKIINDKNAIQGYEMLHDGYISLGIASMLDSSINLETDEVILLMKNALGKKFGMFVSEFIANTDKILNSVSDNNISQEFESYNDALRSINHLIQIGEAFDQKIDLLSQTQNKYIKKYNILNAEYSLYGDMSNKNLMDIVVEEFILDNAHDPSSIQFVKKEVIGKTTNGILYFVRFRGKDALGNLKLESKNLLLKWDVKNQIYYVAGIQ